MQTRGQEATEAPIEKAWRRYCHSEQSRCNHEVREGDKKLFEQKEAKEAKG
jgi:hypothetical protein